MRHVETKARFVPRHNPRMGSPPHHACQLVRHDTLTLHWPPFLKKIVSDKPIREVTESVRRGTSA